MDEREETRKILRQLNEERARIKNCPFCASGAKISEFAGWFFVMCKDGNCRANGPTKGTRDEAIEAWNRGVKDG